MDKKIIAILAFCMAATLAGAESFQSQTVTESIFGGESVSFDFARCDYLLVNISPSQQGEWSAQGCADESAGNFYCLCSDGYVLNLTAAKNSVGDFDILMTNYYDVSMPPRVFIISPTNTTYTKVYLPLTFASDARAFFTYSLDGRRNITIRGNTTLWVDNGKHSIIVYARDRQGLVGTSEKVFFSYCLGDVNGDKRVTATDVGLIASRLWQHCFNRRYVSDYDLNSDCVINYFDVWAAMSRIGDRC